MIKTDEQMVYERIMRGYEASARPRYNQTDQLTVNLRIQLKQIVELNGHTQMLTTVLYIEQKWFDDYLRWNHTSLADVRSLRIPTKQIWTPDTFVFNNAGRTSSGFLRGLHALVKSNGQVTIPAMVKLNTSCRVNVDRFPFDRQICDIQFGSWIYPLTWLSYQFDGNRNTPDPQSSLIHMVRIGCSNSNDSNLMAFDTSSYWDSSAWIFVAASLSHRIRPTDQLHLWSASKNYETLKKHLPGRATMQRDLVIRLYMQRQSFYYIWNVVIPFTLLTVLSSLTFWTPVESGEKITLGLSVFLAFSMFMVLIVEEVPPTPDNIPLLGIYMTTVMTLTATSVVASIIVVNINGRGVRTGSAPPECLRNMMHTRLLRWLLNSPQHGSIRNRRLSNKHMMWLHQRSPFAKPTTKSHSRLLRVQSLLLQLTVRLRHVRTRLNAEMEQTRPSTSSSSMQNSTTVFSELTTRDDNTEVQFTRDSKQAGPSHRFHEEATTCKPILEQLSSERGCANTDEDQTALERLTVKRLWIQYEWSRVARLLDLIFFSIYILASIVTYSTILLWPNLVDEGDSSTWNCN